MSSSTQGSLTGFRCSDLIDCPETPRRKSKGLTCQMAAAWPSPRKRWQGLAGIRHDGQTVHSPLACTSQGPWIKTCKYHGVSMALGGWPSINPSYFDVHHRGYKVLNHCMPHVGWGRRSWLLWVNSKLRLFPTWFPSCTAFIDRWYKLIKIYQSSSFLGMRDVMRCIYIYVDR